MRKTLFVSLFLIVVGFFLVACSGSNSGNGQKPEQIKYTIEMSEFAYTPNQIQAKVGQELVIELVNKGALTHELMIGREVKMHDNRPDGYEQDMFEIAHVEPDVAQNMQGGMDMSSDSTEEEHSGFMVSMPTGSDNATISFIVTKEMVGEWEIGCFEQDGIHYDAGMKGTLIVTQ